MIQTYLLGGYTKRENKGISSVTFDAQTGSFGNVLPIAALNNPTWITTNADKTVLFIIDKEEKSGLVALKKDANGIYIKIAECYATEVSGCHITFNDETGFLYVSNYHEGSIDIYYFSEDEQLSLKNRVFHDGSSVHPNQASSHIHMTLINQNTSQLYACDLGSDNIYVYNLQPNGGLDLHSTVTFPPGTGPRHIVIHPTLSVAYVIGELANTTSILRINEDQTMSLIDTLQNIPKEYTEESAGAAIRITNDGQYLYTSTRFHNIITAYRIDSVGMLSQIQQISSYGEIPRDFILDTTEQFLLIPHQDTDNIAVLSRNHKTGLLKKVREQAFAPECVNITLG